MARSAPVIPVNAKMYRHFAIATVLITGCLAMFASGENREALTETIEAQQRRAQVQEVERKATAGKPIGKKGNFTDKRKVQGSFSSDSDLSWSPPPGARRSSGVTAITQAELVAASELSFADEGEAPSAPSAPSAPVVVTGPLPPGMSPTEYAQMSGQKKNKRKPPPASRPMTQREIDAMMAASDARSRTRSD